MIPPAAGAARVAAIPRQRRWMLALALLLYLAQPAPGHAHPYHTSFAEIDWNSDRSALEVALRVLPEDLETALTWRRGAAVTLGRNHRDEELTAYLQQHFQVFAGAGVVLPLELIGVEIAYAESWLYFQISATPDQRLSLRNTLLLDVDRSQTNRVQPLWAGPGASLVFSAAQPEQTLWPGR